MSEVVSICLPLYNGEEFLQECLDSIAAQNYRPLEIVVSDHGSTDNGLSIVESFAASTDIPVSVHSFNGKGIGANWNNSVRKSKGSHIKFLFQDDVMHPDCVQKMMDALNEHPECGMSVCKRSFIYSTDSPELKAKLRPYEDLQAAMDLEGDRHQIIDKSIFGRTDFMSSPLNKIGEPVCILFKKDLFARIGPYREDLEQILDYEFCYRSLLHAPTVLVTDHLVKFRIHEKQTSQQNSTRQLDDFEKWDRMLYEDYLPFLHSENRKRLKDKYHPWPEFKRRIKSKLGMS